MSTLNSPANNTMAGLSRSNQLWLGLLLIQLAITAFIFWPSQEAAGSQLTITGFTLAEVNKLTITDNESQQIILQKEAGNWVWPEADNYPAVESKVVDLLSNVVGLETNRLVTRTEASHKRLQVADDDFSRQITIETSTGDSPTLYVGSSPNAGSTHLRLAGQPETYLTDALNAWQITTQPASWLDADYLNIPADTITNLQVQNSQGDLAFSKAEDGSWTLADLTAAETALPNNISALVNQLGPMRMVKPLGKTTEAWYGLDNPQATITVTSQNEGEEATLHTIEVGATNDDDQYVVKASNSEYYVLVASFIVRDFIEQDRTHYLAEPVAEPESSDSALEAPSESE